MKYLQIKTVYIFWNFYNTFNWRVVHRNWSQVFWWCGQKLQHAHIGQIGQEFGWSRHQVLPVGLKK